MIYELVKDNQPIEQGDIFSGVPKIHISLLQMDILDENPVTHQVESRQVAWLDTIEQNKKPGGRIQAVLPMLPVDAVVITQTCDAGRAEYVSLCEIVPIADILKGSEAWTSSQRWVDNVTKQGAEQQRWFYLPPGGAAGYTERKAVDFRTVIRVSRSDLDALRCLRRARLNHVAYEHFREKLAQFFRRYPYNPWYPLSKDEFKYYALRDAAAKPYEWQMG